jgi:hypothetical protein
MTMVPYTRRRTAGRHGRPLHSRPDEMKGENTILPWRARKTTGETTAPLSSISTPTKQHVV